MKADFRGHDDDEDRLSLYGHDFQPENLQKLILSETCIFDVLPDFFYHANKTVRNAALEVYVRRAYIAYDITCLQHHELTFDIPLVFFQFMLPVNHPNRDTQSPVNYYNYRIGAMAAFKDFEELNEHSEEILDLLEDSASPNSISAKILEAIEAGSESRNSTSINVSLSACLETQGLSETDASTEPIRILSIAVQESNGMDDNSLARKFANWCAAQKEDLTSKGIRRVTFSAQKKKQFPKFFTFRYRDGFVEDRIYRHIEPGCAFHIEFERMKNFDLEALLASNQRMHIYLGKAKVGITIVLLNNFISSLSFFLNRVLHYFKAAKGQKVADYRLFIRSIIRHSDLITKEASFEYLRNEGERVLLEAMDELELAFSRASAEKTDCNHIFLNFIPTVIMDPARIEESVTKIVIRYGPRLWALRVRQVY